MTSSSTQQVQALSLPEQLVLLAVDPDRGRISGSPMVYVAMAGGVVLDLVDGGVATVQDGEVRVERPTTATALPGMLQQNAVAAVCTDEPRGVTHWVCQLAAPRFRLGQQVAAALARRGVLRVERARRFGIFPVQRQRLLDRQAREELCATARLALVGAAQPALRVRELLVLAGAAGLVDRLADPPQRTAARQRIDRLTSQGPVIGAVGQAVAEVQAEVRAARRRVAVAAAIGGTHGG
ncbi:GPP34 family phosphoprotein [Geodermatophilus sp. TF02-6]|uniref:GOLPH3/VPS74 family protein n=1 Tax=Geodermatophilus sp. TF02-6 TaxID=2250575 RepID=UPI001314047D|nr:GPP34 family phosphoprotein [Geodermatophilus sp. TF02-6]